MSFYGDEYADLKPINGDERFANLGEYYEILRKCWRRETAAPGAQAEWVPEDPSYGQCAITSMLVHDVFGGEIYKIRVDGGGTHYFNKIDGHYIDLTREQFDLYDIPVADEPNELVAREYCGKNPDTQKRFETLRQNVEDYLNGRG